MRSPIQVSCFILIVVGCAACEDARITAPTAVTATLSTPTPAASVFPQLQGQSRAFNFDRALSYPVSSYTRSSRMILYDNGAFVLEYPAGVYRGRYTEAGGAMNFLWEGWSGAGPWGATGTIASETLTIEYNAVMSMSDFENAVYTRSP
jgi:hypothetical protein